MSIEQTLSMIKPDVVETGRIGAIVQRLEEGGLRVIALKMLHLDRERAQAFYAEHRERDFFPKLVEYMSSGPVVVQVLEGKNAILRNRELMGHTDPQQAAPGTIRADFASSIDANAVHGSDSETAARREIDFFFGEEELCSR